MKVGIKIVRPGGKLPRQATKGSAGWDVHAVVNGTLIIQPHDRVLVPTGLVFDIPANHEIQVRPRSGLALKHGITVLNSPGTIDESYAGEVGIILINHGEFSFPVNNGERIAQLIVAPILDVEFVEFTGDRVGDDRGGGFGSTGIK